MRLNTKIKKLHEVLNKTLNIMELNKLDREFGTDAKNNIDNVHQKSINGALACLETFYYFFNNKEIDILKKVWYSNDLIQLNNPLGGIVRGMLPIVEVYDKIFNARAKVWVKFTNIIYYATADMIVFAGTEIGEFTTHNETIPLKIRTSRIFGYSDNDNCWFQMHHHGSIDSADLLSKYQNAVKK